MDQIIRDYDKMYQKAKIMAKDDYSRSPEGAALPPGAAPKMHQDDVRYHLGNMVELAKIERITINNITGPKPEMKDKEDKK